MIALVIENKNHLSILTDRDLYLALTVLVLHVGKVFTVVLTVQRLGTHRDTTDIRFLGKPRNMQIHTPFEIHSVCFYLTKVT